MLLARKLYNRQQSLKEHSWAVAEKTSKICFDCGLPALGKLTGLIHDFGKSYDKWQHYMDDGGRTVPHAPPGVEFAKHIFGGIKERCGPLTLQMICLAIRGHHGGLHDVLLQSGEIDEALPSQYSQDEIIKAENSFFSEVAAVTYLEKLYSRACCEVENLYIASLRLVNDIKGKDADRSSQANEAMFYMGLAMRLLYSALIDADRLNAATWEDEVLNSDESFPEWGKMQDALMRRLQILRDKSNESIGKLRSEISNKCGDFNYKNGVFKLSVPTGGGKTLSSLRLALNVAEKYDKKRIVYAIPYLTILEQNANEIRVAIGEDEKSNVNIKESAVLEHHSNVNIEDDEETETYYAKRTERWDAPIVMTSTVQLLNTLFSERPASARRMAALANSVIIVDEVQAIPTSCTYLFSLAVNFLAYFCNCVVILCTATPPELTNLKYSVRIGTPPDVVDNISELFHTFKRTQIITKPGEKYNNEELVAFILDKLNSLKNCLVIMNTKTTAKKLYNSIRSKLPKDWNIYYLSTELCPAHRKKKLGKIIEELESEKVLLISTQLIEAGVDISFQCVIRALAGLDSIVQAAGRCNRHNKDSIGDVYVVNCLDEHLKMLPDISKGKAITEEIIAAQPEADLSDPNIVRQYYERFFMESKGSLGYSFENKSAIDLLGFNTDARNEYFAEQGRKFPSDLLAQSFRTVGKAFKPILDNTIGVVVPYGESKSLLEQLRTASSKEKRSIYRSLQRYCVNVYEQKLRELQCNHIIWFDKSIELWILKDGFYSEEEGLVTSITTSVDDYIQ